MTIQPITQFDSVSNNIGRLDDRYLSKGDYQSSDDWQSQLLRAVRLGSAGVVVLVAGYEPHMPHFGTSPSVVDSRSMARVAPVPLLEPTTEIPTDRSGLRDFLAMTFADQTRAVLAALSLNKSQLADVLGVTRPTIYDWLDGKEPNITNAQRVTNVLRLLAAAGVTVSNPLNARFMRQPLGEGGTTLIDALRSPTLDEERVVPLMREVKSMGESADTRRRNREEKLRALGFEEPSDEQRKEQLARNIAMRDWPKV